MSEAWRWLEHEREDEAALALFDYAGSRLRACR